MEKAQALHDELEEASVAGLGLCSFTPDQVRRFEEIETKRVEGMLLADKKCRQVRTGAHPWSPRSQIIDDAVQHWKKVRNELQGRRIKSRTIKRLARRAKIEQPEAPPTLEEAKQQLTLAHRNEKATLDQ